MPPLFLLLFLLPGVVPPAAAQPALSLQPSGELTMMEHAVPTGVYSDERGDDGLLEARGIAVSGDLLFVTAHDSDALSVWRVNAEAGTLTQTEFQEGSGLGLDGATDAAVSGDGKLLFVTGRNGDTLSVWQVNAEAGTLSQTALYQDNNARRRIEEVDGRFNGLMGAWTAAVSGNLLFITGFVSDTLSVWRVNTEAGTLSQSALYQDPNAFSRINEVNGRLYGLDGALDVAVSGDGDLLFVAAQFASAISVWRVNKSLGTLTQTALYQDNNARRRIEEVDGRFNGLNGAVGVAVSDDGDLLFVTGRNADALSVWRVNAEAGTLSQAALYQDNGVLMDELPYIDTVDGRVDGLDGARTVAVSGDLLFVAAQLANALSVWRVNAEAGTLSQTVLYRDGNPGIDGLEGAWDAAVSGNLLFVTGQDDNALSTWHINNAEVALEMPTVISARLDMPVEQEVMVTVTAQSGARMKAVTEKVTFSPGEQFRDATFSAGTLGPGRWIFTARANPPSVLETGAARIAVQVVGLPLLSLESRQERFAAGNTVTLTVRASATLPIAASYRIIARRLDLPRVPEVDFAVTHPAGSTAVTVLFPGQSLPTGQWQFSLQLPDFSPFQVGDSATAFISTAALSLQPSGVLIRMVHAVPTDIYLDSPETGGMNGVRDVALSGDLLFATEFNEDTLSVWRVNAEAGTLSRIVRYRDNMGDIDGLDGALNVAVSDDGKLLFVTANEDDTLSVWQVNASLGTLERTALYQDLAAETTITGVDARADGLDGARDVAVSGKLLFVTASEAETLSVWRVNASSGTLEQTALYQDSDVQDTSFNYIENVDGRFDGLSLAEGIAVSGKLLFVTALNENAVSVWQVNAEAGTLLQTGFYQRLVAGEPSSGPAGLVGAWGVALSGDDNLLFVTAVTDDALSVWRVNAEAGTLTQTALYQDPAAEDQLEIAEVDGQVDGLFSPIGVAVSGDLLFVAGHLGGTLSVWQINAETGTLTQTALYQDPELEELVPIAEVDGLVDGLDGAFNIAVSGDLLFVTVFDAFNRRVETGLSAWHINNAEVSLEEPTVISVQLDLPVDREVMVTVTAQSGARMKAVTATVTFSPGMLSRDAIFPAGALGIGRWIFTAQADPPTVLETGAARIAVQVVVVPLLSLELRQERFAVGNTVTLTVRSSAALPIAAPYRIIARRLDLPSAPEVDFAVTHPAGSTEVTVSIPGQSLSTGQWEFSIQLPGGSPFRVGDSATAFISTPRTLTLQPSGVLIKREHAVPTEVYFDSAETDGLGGVRDVALSGDLLFVTAFFEDTLSVWRVNAEAGTLRQTMRYRDNIGEIDGLDGAAGIAVSDDGKLLFVAAVIDEALSVWRVNAEAGTLGQAALYQDSGLNQTDTRYIAEVDGRIDGLSGANHVALSDDGKLLFVTARDDNALSVWRVNAEAGTLRRTALYSDEVDLREVARVAVSDDGSLLFVTAFLSDTLSVWQVNAEAGTLTRTALYQNGVGGIAGLNGAVGVAVSGDLLFVTGSLGNVLSVWQVNAEEGTLMQTMLYRDRIDQRRGVLVDGLHNPRGVAVSGDLLFATGFFSDALSVWQVNAEAGTLGQIALYQDSGLDPMDRSYVAEVDGRVDGLNGAFNIAVSGDLLFVAGFEADALSAWHINNAAVSLEEPTVISVQLDMPVEQEVMVTVTAQSGARMKPVTAMVTFSPGDQFRDATFSAGTLSPGRWIFTAQADPPAVLETGAARIAVQVFVVPLLSLESRQEQFAVGNTVTLTVRASAALQIAAPYRIIARRLDLPSAPEVDFAVTHPAGSTEVTVSIPGQSLSTGQWEFSIQLPDRSSFRVSDSVTAFIFTPALLSLQPSGMLTMMEHAVPTGVYFDSPETDGLAEASDVAVSGDLLFVTGPLDDALSVWRVNYAAGTLSQTAVYQDSGVPAGDRIENVDGLFNGLAVASGVAVSGDGELLFVTEQSLFGDDSLSVWRVNAEAGTLSQTARYEDGIGGINGLDGASDVAVSGDGELLFVTAGITDHALSVWRVNAEAGTLSQTARYEDRNMMGGINGLTGASGVAVSGDGELLFVTAGFTDHALSVWRVNAEAGTLSQTALYEDGIRGIDGLFGATDVAVSDGLLFVTAGFSDDALSVWRVNAEAGTLSQTALYQDSGVPESRRIGRVDGRIDGLGGAFRVAVGGDLLFVTGRTDSALSVWRVNAEAGTLSQTALYQDSGLNPTDTRYSAEVDGRIDGLSDAFRAAVGGDLLFVTGRTDSALSAWQINNAEVALEMPTVISVQLDMPVDREVMVTVTARNSARMKAVTATVTFSPGDQFRDTTFFAGTLSPGRWIFTAQADPPTVLETGAARSVVRVVPLLSLEAQQQQFAVGNTVTLTVRVSAALQVAASYRIIARRLGSPSAPEVDFAVTHPAGSTEVTVPIPGQSLSTGQWEFSIQLPGGSPFRVGDSVTVFIFTPALLSLQPSGVLTRMGHAVPTGVYFDSSETDGLAGASDVAVSGDLLFVTGALDDSLSVWRVNYAAGTLSQITVYQDSGVPAGDRIENVDGLFNGLAGALDIAVSGDDELLFVIGSDEAALSVWRVNSEAGTLSQTARYEDGIGGVNGLAGASGVAVSGDGDLLFVTEQSLFGDDSLSVWRVNSEAGTLSQTARYEDGIRGIDGLDGASDVAVSGDGELLFVTAGVTDHALSVWRVNAEAGTLSQTALYKDGMRGINGLTGASGVAVSGDGELLFVTAGFADYALSVWRVNAEAGTLSQTALYEDGIRGIDGLFDATDVAVSDGLLFVTAGFSDDALSVWRVNAEAGTLSQTALYQDSGVPASRRIGRVDGRVDGLGGAFRVAVGGDLLFVTGQSDNALSAWQINNAEVPLEVQTLIRVQSNRPVSRQVIVTVTAQNGARTEAKAVTLSPEILSDDAIFPAGTLSPGGRWIFTAQADPPTVLDTEAARIAVRVVPLLSLELRQERFAVGNTVTLTVRSSAALPIAAPYRIIARRLDLPSAPEVDFAVTHPAGSTEVTVSIPGQSLSTGQWEFSIQLPDGSPFRVGDSATAFISTPRTLTLQPSGVLIKREHAVPTEVYFDSAETDGLGGVRDIALSGDLLFVTAFFEDTLSVWRVNAEAGTLRQTMRYRDNIGEIDGLDGAAGIAVSDDGKLLFVAAVIDEALSVWRVNAEAGTLGQAALYQDSGLNQTDTRYIAEVDGRIDGLSGANHVALSDDGKLLFVTARDDNALSVWRVNAEAGTLRRTALYSDEVDLREVARVAVSDDGSLLFVTAFLSDTLSVWQVNAEAGTLTRTALYQNGVGGIAGLNGAVGVAVSGDLLFVTGSLGNVLSVWQVNAEEGTLMQTMLYRDRIDQRRGVLVDGLHNPRSVAVSGDLLFATGFFSDALSVWQVDAEAGTLGQIALYQDSGLDPVDRSYVAEVDGRVDGLNGAFNIAVSGDLLFVAGFEADALSVWHINNAAVSLEEPTVISVQLDMPVEQEVMVTVTAQSGARMKPVTATVTFSPGDQFRDATFSAGTLSPGRWIFTAQADPPAVLETGAARIAVQVFVVPLLSLESQQEQFAVGNTVTLTVRASAALQIAAPYRIIARRLDLPSAPEVDFAVTHPAGSTEVTVSIPGQSLSTGQWEFSIQLPDRSSFRVGDSATAFISTPRTLTLQPSGVLIKRGHAVPTDAYLDSPEPGSMNGVRDVALSGDLLFATEFNEDTLSVWRVNAEAGTLSRIVRYRDNTNGIDGLDGASGVALSDNGKLLFVTANEDDALSVWRVNASSGALEQNALYQDLAAKSTITEVDGRADGLDGARDVVVSGKLLFVTANEAGTLSVWRVNASSGTLEQTALYQDSDVQDASFNYIENVDGRFDGLSFVEGIAVSGKLLFVTALNENAVSVWQVNAEAGTLTRTGFYQRLVAGEPSSGPAGLLGAWGVAVSGDDNLLFVTAVTDDALSVWRVNAEAGTLTQTALYQDPEAEEPFPIAEVDGQVDGLFSPIGVAVSGDLLFVAGHLGGTLSVWQINAETGTLTQTAIYQDPAVRAVPAVEEQPLAIAEVDGLDGAFNIAVSGDLLFVTVFDAFNRRVGTGLSAWHINNAAVSLEMPTVVSVQLDLPVERGVMVTVTARNSARMKAVTATVTFSPGDQFRDATFPPGTLSPGRWIFTAQAEPPALLNTGAARIAMQVLAPVRLTLDVPGSVTVSDDILMVTVGVAAEMPLPEGVSVMATVSFHAGDGEEIEREEVVLTSVMSSNTLSFTAPDTVGRYTVAARGIRSDSILLPVTGTAIQVTVQPVLALDVPSAPIYRGVMFPVRVRLLGGLLEDNGSVGVTVYLRDAVTDAVVLTRTATLSTAASSMVLTFEAVAGEAAVTPYSLTTEDIDQTGLAPRTSAVISLQNAAPATIFVTRINVDLSGNGVFDTNDVILIARGFLTENHTARIAGGFSRLDRDTFQIRLEELADFGDISGNGVLDIIDLIFLTRNTDVTVSDLRERVMTDDNPFAYLCGSPASDACEDIDSPHQNITLPEGIRYEAIGEVLDDLRRVPQPPILSLPNNR